MKEVPTAATLTCLLATVNLSSQWSVKMFSFLKWGSNIRTENLEVRVPEFFFFFSYLTGEWLKGGHNYCFFDFKCWNYCLPFHLLHESRGGKTCAAYCHYFRQEEAHSHSDSKNSSIMMEGERREWISIHGDEEIVNSSGRNSIFEIVNSNERNSIVEIDSYTRRLVNSVLFRPSQRWKLDYFIATQEGSVSPEQGTDVTSKEPVISQHGNHYRKKESIECLEKDNCESLIF